MRFRTLWLATAAIALTACAAPKNETRDTAAAAAAGRMSAPDSMRATGTAGARSATDSVGRNPIDTARVGKDTGRQSQNPTKQP